ncbi:NAD(P)/FAD-dependent oxidoreductase [Nocardiopsis ansamitocini]|uniref:Pyridine nucleotide-disulfide oxidoreductase n=1 Tax=Nocardiopsis ansamitocini TaxID=1670832 RepID=A0A9W6P5A9_9ACTN|nr:FAD-dependent oxidoreductase [Nocardiopsis ansamitocini]GLU47650.1 pyridine nucleotide-disulfide oxidoreductase [Nocardiopsis ansamitocini]
MREVVVVGAGLAGLSTAEALRGAGFDGTITLVGEEAHEPYSRPPLSKELLTGKGTGAGVRLRGPEELSALDLDLRLGVRALALHPGERAVELSDGSRVTGDSVVIATGGAARRPDTTLSGVHVLRTLDDAEALRAELAEHERITVVGAGFIGAEVAASARALGLEVTLIEAAATPLTRTVDPRVGSVLAELHRDNGVDLRVGVGVRALEGTGRVERVRLADDSTVEASLVVAGLGVNLNTGWLAGSGVELDAGDQAVRCDEHCATSLPGVYAAGDLASWPHPRYGGRTRLEHWTNAGEQAAVVAHNLLAGSGTRWAYQPVPYFWSDQYGAKVQLLGQATPADSVEIVHGSPESRKFVAFFGRAGMLVGVLGLRSTPKTMRYRKLLEQPTAWTDALAAAAP